MFFAASGGLQVNLTAQFDSMDFKGTQSITPANDKIASEATEDFTGKAGGVPVEGFVIAFVTTDGRAAVMLGAAKSGQISTYKDDDTAMAASVIASATA